MPASRHCFRSAARAWAVMAMMGVCLPHPSSSIRIRLVASIPSISGIWMSHEHDMGIILGPAGDPLDTVPGEDHMMSLALQDGRGETTIHGIVLDHQDAPRPWGARVGFDAALAPAAAVGLAGSVAIRDRGEGQGEALQAPRVGRAVEAEGSAHPVNEPVSDAQAESRAPVGAGVGIVPLLEGFEEGLLPGRFETDARILNREAERAGRLAAVDEIHADAHETEGGEFHGVARQVREYLHEPAAVTLEVPVRPGGDVLEQMKPLVLSFPLKHAGYPADDRAQPEGAVVQLDLSGLQLGEIQQVLDDHHQPVRRFPQHGQETLLIRSEGGSAEQFRHAQHAVHGGSQLVGDLGQEKVLGLVGRFRRFLGRSKVGLGPLVLQSVPKRALEQGGGNIALDEVIRGPRFHGHEIHVEIRLAREQDHGKVEVPASQLGEELETVPVAQAIVEKNDRRRLLFHDVEPGVEGFGPAEGIRPPGDLLQAIPGEDVIVIIVLDQKDVHDPIPAVFDLLAHHSHRGVPIDASPESFPGLRPQWNLHTPSTGSGSRGRSTISSQYLPRVFVTSMRPSKVTGLVM